jgi:hypothetical protein
MADPFAKNFCRHRDGSWTCISAATLDGFGGRIEVAAGSRFYPGTIFMGFDVAKWLEAIFAQDAVEREGYLANHTA